MWLGVTCLIGCLKGTLMPIKPLDMLGNCQRPVFSLGVSQHMHTKQACENLSSIWSSNNNEEKTHLLYKFVCFEVEIKAFSWSEKIPVSQALCYFRGSPFSQCVNILSTALCCSSLPSKFLCKYILSNYFTCPCLSYECTRTGTLKIIKKT